MDLPLLAENQRFDTIPGNMITAHLHLRRHLAGEPKIQKRIVEVLLAGGVPMTVNSGPHSESRARHLSAQPQNFVDVVDRHVRQESAALISIGSGIGVFHR